MGFDDGRIILDSPNGTYYSGQKIRGNLIFQQDTVKTFRGIFLKFHGFCKVHWTTTETRRVNGKNVTRTKHHNSYEQYVKTKVYLIGGESGEHHLQPGKYDFPFTFQLPANCPSSFEGVYGHVRYKIKAVVDKAFKIDQKKKVAVRVMAPLDLNMDPYCREPMEMDFKATYYCCCFKSGTTDTVVNIPKSGYCPGQIIPIEISCTNKGTVKVDHIKIRIKKKIVFIATHHPGRRALKDVVAEIKKGPIPPNTTRNWTVEMEVPALDVYNLSGCKYIELHYKLEVVASPSGCHRDSKESRKIVIGTIPLVGFQDNVVNPLQDQMPQQITAVTQQLPSYPITSPYPHGSNYNPYPTNETSPYPPPNLPYPTAPNTISNLPYPPNVPYPGNPPPYPGNNSCYPVQENVTSDQMGSGKGIIKTSDVEFTDPGSSNIPFPGTTSVPVNPYMDASAPTLDTPDTEKNKENE